jgi:hypothetical protein
MLNQQVSQKEGKQFKPGSQINGYNPGNQEQAGYQLSGKKHFQTYSQCKIRICGI